MAGLHVKRTAPVYDVGSPVVAEAPTTSAGAADYIERNRAAWESWASKAAVTGRKAWRDEELLWGLWSSSETELQLFHELQPGADVVELGCGTAAIAAWLARSGARPVAVDFSRRQLNTAEQLQHEFGISFPLIGANAENVPFEEGSFDFAISEYGVSLWCDPRRWLPEANRLLRPGGQLIYFTSGAMMMACTPFDGGMAGDMLVRDYFSSYRVEFPGEDAVEFHLTHGHWVRLLRASGFVLENLIEVRPPRGAKSRFGFASTKWARRWPSEEIWVARKCGEFGASVRTSSLDRER
jgi:SAM-dependent methyltransferase